MIKSNCRLRLLGLIKIRKINWPLENSVLSRGAVMISQAHPVLMDTQDKGLNTKACLKQTGKVTMPYMPNLFTGQV